jgi:hypothetical protein
VFLQFYKVTMGQCFLTFQGNTALNRKVCRSAKYASLLDPSPVEDEGTIFFQNINKHNPSVKVSGLNKIAATISNLPTITFL